jgi:outer membrane protein OmpA-like peptidoglycan-associated protein
MHAVSKKALASEISFYNAKSRKDEGLSNSDSLRGEFKMILPLGVSYEVLTMKKGYYAGTELLDLTKTVANPEQKIDILLFPLEKGITIPISRLTFDNKTQVTESGIGEIDRLVHLLEQYPDMKIDLHGPKSDAQAREKAAKAQELLKKSGIKADRLLCSQTNAMDNFSFTILADKPQKIEQKNELKEFNNAMDVSKITTGESFKINNLFFLADSSSFTPNTKRSLDELAEFLVRNSNIQVEIGSHTNGLPSHEYCDKLSSERASNVVKYLISKGVKPSQLSPKGYGKRAPIADNSTESGRKMNQRVEVKVLKVN